MATIKTVVKFIDQAGEAEMETLAEAMRVRIVVLREERKASLRAGAQVTLSDMVPKALNGLTGVVKGLYTVRGAERCSVLLDRDSTRALRNQGNRFSTTVSPATSLHLLEGVPMASCVVSS